MFRIDDSTASNTLPAPEAPGTEGYWTEGNPGSGIPATLERASWFNMIQEELRAVVVAGGLTPSKTTYNQVLSAINALIIASFTGAHQSLGSANGWQDLPGGLILQWGQFTQSDVATTATAYSFALPKAFPTGTIQAFGSIGNQISTGVVTISVEAFTTTHVSGYTYSPDTLSRVYRIFAIGH